MALSMWNVLLFCVLSSAFIHHNQREHDPNNTLALLMPNRLFLDHGNTFIIHSRKKLTHIAFNTTASHLKPGHQLFMRNITDPPFAERDESGGFTYRVNYEVPFETKYGINIKFAYCYCPNEKKGCPTRSEEMCKTITKHNNVQTRNTWILGETDKPMYRPGDLIRFRFVALTNRQVIPTNLPPIWPKLKAVGQGWGEHELIPIDPSELQRRLQPSHFDAIELLSPLNLVVQQWRDVPFLQAFNLSHRLIADAKTGQWKIRATIFNTNEDLLFEVRHYELPRFTAKLEMSDEIAPSQNELHLNVCATYTNGPAMPGVFDAQLCICDRSVIESWKNKGLQIEGNACGAAYGAKKRQCLRKSGILDRQTGCAQTVVNMSQLANTKSINWGDQLGAFVQVEEEGTGSSVVAVAVAKLKVWRDPTMELDFPPAFRIGLPTVGHLKIKNAADLYNVSKSLEFDLTVLELQNPCGGWWRNGPNADVRNPTLLRRRITMRRGDHSVQIVLPPLNTTRSINVRVAVIRDKNDTSKFATPHPIMPLHGRPWIPRPRPFPDLETSASLSPWESSSQFAIQITKVVDANTSCPGSVTFEVLSNQPMEQNTPFKLMYVSRGVLMSKVSSLKQDYSCTPRDDDFGHYECTEDGGIVCLEGWGAENCQIPQCGEQGCQGNGVCVAPHVCECKIGWTGDACEICLPRTGCSHGDCVIGDDCVCHRGYSGYLCGYAEVLLEETKTDTNVTTDSPVGSAAPLSRGADKADYETAHRTVFRHTVTFNMDDTFGPELHAVAVVYKDSNMANDFVKLENLQMCSSPALADTTVAGLWFQRQSLIPGENVRLSIHVPASTPAIVSSQDTDNVCLIRMADVALENYKTDNTRTIDLTTYTNTLNGQFGRYGGYRIGSSERAFIAAGIDYSLIAPIDRDPTEINVCFLHDLRQAPMVSGIPGPAAFFKGNDIPDFSSKPRLRDFFPEVWTFDYVTLTNGTYNTTLKVPDSLTSWEANAVCFTADKGLWMPHVKPKLTVAMPFFVEFTPPVKARRGEILHLPISVFVHPLGEGEPNECYEVAVSVQVDNADWSIVGVGEFDTCLCTGDLKETFKLPLKPLKIGQLNVTATARGKKGSRMCSSGGDDDDDDNHVITVGDAVRRTIRVVPEGVETTFTSGGTFCTDGNSTSASMQWIPTELPIKDIVKDSLRSYISVSGNVMGKALNNLESLVQLPTGCGEQNLVKVAPSVHVLRYLLRNLNNSGVNASTSDSLFTSFSAEELKLLTKAARYIMQGYDNQLNYRHPDNGAFSTFGPKYGAKGNTWLTAYVFEVFSHAETLPLRNLVGEVLDAHATLEGAFDFLVSQQRVEDGCFEEAGQRFAFWMESGQDVERHLALTAHVLSALTAATPTLREAKRNNYTTAVAKATNCIVSSVNEYKPEVWPTLMLAKVVKALGGIEGTKPDILKSLIMELISRSNSTSSFGGSLKWWPESERKANGYHSRALAVDTTAHALLGLTVTKTLPSEDLLSIIRWLSQQQNEKGGFYSTQDTVVALQALASVSNSFPSPIKTTPVTVGTSAGFINANVSKENQLVTQIFPLPAYEMDDVKSMSVVIESKEAVCITAHFTSFFNIPKIKEKKSSIEIVVSTDQGESKATAQCTKAITTVCLNHVTQKASGMLLVSIQLPSSWVVLANELSKIPVHGALKRTEYDSKKQEVNAYFDGFAGTDDVERCVSIPMHQRIYVEDAKPGLVRAYDYYATDDRTERNLELDPCKLYWDPPMGGIENSTDTSVTTSPTLPATTPRPSQPCPTCEALARDKVSDQLTKSLCNYDGSLHVYVKHEDVNSTHMTGRLYSVSYGSRLGSWNTTLLLGKHCNCTETKLVDWRGFGFFGDYVYPGDLEVELAGRRIITLESLSDAAPEFLEKVRIKSEAMRKEDGLNGNDALKQNLRYCHNAAGFSALLKKLSNLIAA